MFIPNDSNTNTNASTNTHTNTHTNTRTNTHTNTHTNTRTNTHTNTNTNANGKKNSNIIRYKKNNNQILKSLSVNDFKNQTINFMCEMCYLNYKKKNYLLNISNDFNLINNFFDEDICDILINIFILKKKNKISKNEFATFEFVFNFIDKINNIVYIDQENFFLILIDFYILNDLASYINFFFENCIFKDLVNYEMLVKKIETVFNKIKNNVLLFKIFDELKKNHLIGDKKTNQNMFINLAQKLSLDFFMFYDGLNIHKLLTNFFNNKIFDKLSHCENVNLMIKKNKLLLETFEENKTIFIREYNKYSKKYSEIYKNDIELYVKFKIIKNDKISIFLKNISYIDKI